MDHQAKPDGCRLDALTHATQTVPTVQALMQMKDGNEAVFETAVAFTPRERSPASFRSVVLRECNSDGLVEGVLSLRARDEFVREWVDDHFLPTLTDCIRSQTGWSVQVAWTIDEGLESPVADQPSSPPVRPRPLTLRPSAPPSAG